MMNMTQLKTEKEKNIEWLKNEILLDQQQLEREKKQFIQQIKNYKREEILPKEEKQTLWKRLKKIIMGI
jgi:protein tyrosine/serine phosphatase